MNWIAENGGRDARKRPFQDHEPRAVRVREGDYGTESMLWDAIRRFHMA